MQKLIKLKNKKGFTLIEMLVVILIIVILIAIAVPAVAGYRASARETADKGAAETIFNALEAATTNHSPAEADNRGSSTLTYVASNKHVRTTNALEIGSADMEGPFLEAVQEFIGTNVHGTFKFQVEVSTGSVNWVTFVREGVDITERANTMIYHAEHGVTGYMDEAIDPTDNMLYDKANKMHDTN